MAELLTKYSLSEIIMFIILLAAALKGFFSFMDWSKDKRRKITLDEMKPEKLAEEIAAEKTEREKQIAKLEKSHAQDVQSIKDEISGVADSVSKIADKVDLLIESDKDDIKSYITREYHYFVEGKGWIDDYSMDCIEKRYSHYVEEKGNSFIGDLIEQLRKLPKRPPKN